MAEYTEHHDLILPAKTENYNVEVANTNNRIIDEELHKRQLAETGKGLSTNDFTNAYKAKLDGLSNYNDTEINEQIDAIKVKDTAQDSSIQAIQQDIEAIQTDNSEQDETIAAMQSTIAEQSRVIALHEKNAKKAYVEPSEHITVTDAAEMDAQIGVYGNSVQKVTEQSENLFCDVFEKYTRPYDYFVMPIKLEQGQTYKLKAELVEGKERITTLAVGIVKAGDRFANFVGQLNCVETTGGANKITITANDTYTDPKLVVFASKEGMSREEWFNLLFTNYNISLTKGSEDKPYTPYVPDSPSTLFPSEIKNCGDNINMFDETLLTQHADNETEEEYMFQSGKLYNKTILPANTVFEEKTAYTLQYVAKQTTGNPRFVFKYTDGTKEDKQISTEYKKIVLVSNLNKTVQTINVDYGSSGQFYLKKGSVQLEKGNRATKVRKYNCGAVHVDTCKTNILNIENIVSGNNLKKFEITEKNIVITPVNASANVAIDIPVYLKKTEQYSLSQTSTTCQLRNRVQIVHNASNNIFSTFALADNVDSIRFWFATSRYVNGTLTIKKSDFMLVKGNYTTDTMLEYEEYQGETVAFPLQEGQRMYEGSYLADDGIHHTRKRIVFDGTINKFAGKSMSIENTVYYTDAVYEVNNNDFVMCSHFKKTTVEIAYNTNTQGIYLENNRVKIAFGKDSELNTLAKANAWLAEQYTAGTPVVVEMKLKETVEAIESCTDEQQKAYDKLQKLTLCKGTNNIFCIDEVPAKVDMTYTVATDMITDKLEARVTAIENAMATANEGGAANGTNS